MIAWDNRVNGRVCNCKCMHCGRKYESATKEYDEAMTLKIKMVKCKQPFYQLVRHSTHFNKVHHLGGGETRQGLHRRDRKQIVNTLVDDSMGVGILKTDESVGTFGT